MQNARGGARSWHHQLAGEASLPATSWLAFSEGLRAYHLGDVDGDQKHYMVGIQNRTCQHSAIVLFIVGGRRFV
jgi:hypothetical protein